MTLSKNSYQSRNWMPVTCRAVGEWLNPLSRHRTCVASISSRTVLKKFAGLLPTVTSTPRNSSRRTWHRDQPRDRALRLGRFGTYGGYVSLAPWLQHPDKGYAMDEPALNLYLAATRGLLRNRPAAV